MDDDKGMSISRRSTNLGRFLLVLMLGTVAYSFLTISKQRAIESSRLSGSHAARVHCSTCHPYPEPGLLPKSAWPGQVREMLELAKKRAPNAPIPDAGAIIEHYVRGAPQALPMPKSEGPIEPWPNSATTIEARFVEGAKVSRLSEVAHAQFLRASKDSNPELLASDGKFGLILASADASLGRLFPAASVPLPGRLTVADFDRDGVPDVLAASLGSYQPSDERNGAVYWLHLGREGSYRPTRLARALGRVADIAAFDADDDGDLDLVVAEFGGASVGGILLLLNEGQAEGVHQFEPVYLDNRPGAVRIIPADLNGDGKMDFVAGIAQETESVVAFIRIAPGVFAKRPLFTAAHPAWGLCGLEPMEFDNDGDLDFLVVNGDTFDNFILKPYHGIGWLENDGDSNWIYHRLADMPAAYCAKPADVDGDGDLDIIAAAFYAPPNAPQDVLASLESVVWIEQLGGGQFKKHIVERGRSVHSSIDVARAAAGDLLIAISNWPIGQHGRDVQKTWPWVEIQIGRKPSSNAPRNDNSNSQ